MINVQWKENGKIKYENFLSSLGIDDFCKNLKIKNCTDIEIFIENIKIEDFKNFKTGSKYIEDCIRLSYTSNYEDGKYYFHFSLDGDEIVDKNREVVLDNDTFSIFTIVDDEVFEGIEDITEFENSEKKAEVFAEICNNLYWKALEIIKEEVD